MFLVAFSGNLDGISGYHVCSSLMIFLLSDITTPIYVVGMVKRHRLTMMFFLDIVGVDFETPVMRVV